MKELLRFPRSFGSLVIVERDAGGAPFLLLQHEGRRADTLVLAPGEVHKLLGAIFGCEALRPPSVEAELPRLRSWLREGQWEAAGDEAWKAKTHGRKA